jgi:transcriptional regulator with XRE-family HTH domain
VQRNVPFSEVLDEALQDPEVRAEWDRTQLARDVSNWLIRYRVEHDLTQAELAQLLGWKQPVVARLESGEHEPSIATLHRLVERLGTTATIAIRAERVEVHFAKPRRLRSAANARHSELLDPVAVPLRRRRKPSTRTAKRTGALVV